MIPGFQESVGHSSTTGNADIDEFIPCRFGSFHSRPIDRQLFAILLITTPAIATAIKKKPFAGSGRTGFGTKICQSDSGWVAIWNCPVKQSQLGSL
jgi:hypothetical protein